MTDIYRTPEERNRIAADTENQEMICNSSAIIKGPI